MARILELQNLEPGMQARLEEAFGKPSIWTTTAADSLRMVISRIGPLKFYVTTLEKP